MLGSEQIVSSPAGRWRAKLTFQRIREEILWMRAQVMALRGRSGTVRIGPFDLIGAPQEGTQDRWALDLGVIDQRQLTPPVGGAAPASLVDAGALMGTEIIIRMQGGRVPGIGIYVGIGGHLHVLTSTWRLNDTDFHATIEPWLRADLPSGTPVEFDNPTCVMRCLTPVDSLTVQGGSHETPVALDLVEAF